MSFEELVRERAYHIWLADGMAHGHAHEHWVCAEQAMRGETASADVVVIITKAAAKPRKAAAAKPAVKAKDTKPAKSAKVSKPTAQAAVKPKAAKSTSKSGAMVQPTTH